MDTGFDLLSKVLGSELPRRQVFKWMGVTTAATVLTSLGVRDAEAANPCKGLDPPICQGGDGCLVGKSGCSCIHKSKNDVVKGPFCANINVTCAELTACSTTADCKAALGAGWKCTTSCCDTQFGFGKLCLQKCGSGTSTKAVSGQTPVGVR